MMPQDIQKIPKAVGVIIDGNRRWAKAKGLPKLEGHRVGINKLKEFVRWSRDAGVGIVYFFTFSTENWNREPFEVSYLMDLFRTVVTREADEIHREGGRVRILGQVERFSPELQKLIHEVEEKTNNNTRVVAAFCLSYGGRPEIVAAAKSLIISGITPDQITEESFASHLWNAGLPDPDLIIRTGGERRLSGFLTWQSVYSELFFTETLWPDFTKEEFLKMLAEYAERERRFGK